jgi:hypothetical protein
MDLTLGEEYWLQFYMKLIAVISEDSTRGTNHYVCFDVSQEYPDDGKDALDVSYEYEHSNALT